MLIRLDDELFPALVKVLRRGVEAETDRSTKRRAEDALVEIERSGDFVCDHSNCGLDQ